MSETRLEKMTNERMVALSERLKGTLQEFRRNDDDENEGGSIVVPTVAGAALGGGAIVAGQAVKKDYGAFKKGQVATASTLRSGSVATRQAANSAGAAGVVSEAANMHRQADVMRAGAKSAVGAANPAGYVKSKLGMAGHAAAPAGVASLDALKDAYIKARRATGGLLRKA